MDFWIIIHTSEEEVFFVRSRKVSNIATLKTKQIKTFQFSLTMNTLLQSIIRNTGQIMVTTPGYLIGYLRSLLKPIPGHLVNYIAGQSIFPLVSMLTSEMMLKKVGQS